MLAEFFKREWAQISTKFGAVALLVSAAIADVAPHYAQFDKRIASVGAIAGVLAIVFREKPRG